MTPTLVEGTWCFILLLFIVKKERVSYDHQIYPTCSFSELASTSLGQMCRRGAQFFMWNMWEGWSMNRINLWKYANDHFLDDYITFTFVVMIHSFLYPSWQPSALFDGRSSSQVKKILNGWSIIDNISRLQENSKRWEIERPRPLMLYWDIRYNT